MSAKKVQDQNTIDQIASKNVRIKVVTQNNIYVLEPFFIPRDLNTGTCINCSCRQAGRPILLCRPTWESALATHKARGGKNGERISKKKKQREKKKKSWMDLKGWKVQTEKFRTVSEACTAIFQLLKWTEGLWQFRALIWEALNFCIHSIPQQG